MKKIGSLILKNAKLSSNQVANIIIENGKIKEITKTLPTSNQNSDKIIDLEEKYVLAGLIDPHVHFRDPGLTHKENWETGSKAAAHGGYTTVIDMPNTLPQTDTKKAFKEKKDIATKKSYVDFGLHAGVKSKNDVDEILEEKPASYKIFMDLYTDQQLDEMFSYISNTNKPLSLHCEDKTIVDNNIKQLQKNPDNDRNTKAYSEARSILAEVMAVDHAIELAIKYNLTLHLCHITSKTVLKLIEPKKSRVNLSIEATPHHLLLDNETYTKYGVKAKTNPPLRPAGYNITIDDLDKFDNIGTDHAPHTLEEKEKTTWESAAGIPNLETSLKLLLTQVNNKKITLPRLEQLMSTNPAKIFNIPSKGQIKVGNDADLVVIDMNKTGKIDLENLYTQGKYTPFENYEYTGSNVMTIKRGEIISEDDEVYKTQNKYIY
ncbi:MAG: dihydroorotase family protein [Methanosphaera sp.]|nr:dihydroorotase family protein [Methanosphaera sp.]